MHSNTREQTAEHLNNADTTQDLEATHKAFAKRIVLPAMGAISVIFYVAAFRADPAVYWLLAFMVPFTLLNAWLSETQKTIKIRRMQIKLRSDAADVFRWIINLVIVDPIAFYILNPPLSIAIPGWTVLLLAAQSELFRSSNRNIVVVLAYLSGVVLFFFIDPSAGLNERLWGLAAMAAILFVFDRMENYWQHELSTRKKTEALAIEQQIRAENMEREVIVASQMRTVMHEISNLLTIVEFATIDQKSFDDIQFGRVRRSLQIIRRINDMVVKQLRYQPGRQLTLVRQIIEDIDMLVGKYLNISGVKFELNLNGDFVNLGVRERSGSVFLILNNLIKNAADAAVFRRDLDKMSDQFQSSREEARVCLCFAIDNDKLICTVEDNGVGMEKEKISELLARQSITTKQSGSGIGLRFVLNECDFNDFRIEIQSDVGQWTRVTLTMPLEPVRDTAVA